jgi:hypothetical protein
MRLSTIDFRLDDPVDVNITFRNPHHVELSGLYSGVRSLPILDKHVDNGPGTALSYLHPRFTVGQGQLQITILDMASPTKLVVLGTVDIHGPLPVHLTYDIPADLAKTAKQRIKMAGPTGPRG